MQQFTIDAPDGVRAKFPKARDHWTICDAGEVPDIAERFVMAPRRRPSAWSGNTSWDDTMRKAALGDNSAVPKSDRLLAEMEQYIPESARRGWLDDVAGAVPNVQAYIAGHPLNMRRRIKVQDEFAPLAIVYDPTCSGGIKRRQIFQRGLTVLALVRALAGRRPVELYVAGGLNSEHGARDAAWFACRIDTAPLDLARAAHMMTATCSVRCVTYGILEGAHKAGGHWPYQNHRASAEHFSAIVRQAMPHVTDVLAIPSIHVEDELLTDPRAWLARTMAELAGAEAA